MTIGMFAEGQSHNPKKIRESIANHVEASKGTHQSNSPKSKCVKIDWEAAKRCCQIFCTKAETAYFIGVNPDTLEHHVILDGVAGSWTEFFKMHSVGGKMSLRRAQLSKAVDEKNTQMLIWMGKQYLGQADKQIVISDDMTEETRKAYNLEELDVVELEVMERILKKVEIDEATK